MNMQENIVLKPNSLGFLWFGLIRSAVSLAASVFIFGIIAAGSGDTTFAVIFGISIFSGIIGFVINLFTKFFEYRKEEYIFANDRIIKKSGSIFADRQVELLVKNITNVELEKPFLEHMLLKTGTISIESAGTSATEVKLISLDNVDAHVEKIKEMMRQNGFKLKHDKLVQQEHPTLWGVVLDVINWLVSLTILAFFGLAVASDSLSDISSAISNPAMSGIVLFGLALGVIGLAVAIVLRYLDYSHRIYRVYEDAIAYEEGFLTRHYSFSPLENLTDSETHQTVFQRLLGISSIVLSTKGTANDITFSSMPNGDILEANIDRLIATLQGDNAAADKNSTTASKSATGKKSQETAATATKATIVAEIATGDSFTGTYKIFWLKTMLAPGVMAIAIAAFMIIMAILLPGLAFVAVAALPVIILGICITLVFTFINIYATTYYIKENSFKYSYNFLSRSEKEFNANTVTAVQFKEDLIDRFLGTCSIVFSSFGSNTKIVFSNIKKTSDLEARVLNKIGIDRAESPLSIVKPQFTAVAYLAQNLAVTIAIVAFLAFFLLLMTFAGRDAFAITAIILGWICLFALALHVGYKWGSAYVSVIEFSKLALVYKSGILTRSERYVLYKYAKSVVSTKYPLLSAGRLELTVPSEGQIWYSGASSSNAANQYNAAAQMGYKGQTNQYALGHRNSIQVDYIQSVDTVADKVDEQILLSEGRDADMEADVRGSEYRPKTINELFPFLISVVIFFPLLIALPLAYLEVKSRYYRVQKERILGFSGWFYRKRISIAYANIDHLDKSRGFVNKIFGTGNIVIYTQGGNGVDLALANLDHFEGCYTELQAKYKSA